MWVCFVVGFSVFVCCDMFIGFVLCVLYCFWVGVVLLVLVVWFVDCFGFVLLRLYGGVNFIVSVWYVYIALVVGFCCVGF